MFLNEEASCLACSLGAAPVQVLPRADYSYRGSLQLWEDGTMDAGKGIANVGFVACKRPLLISTASLHTILRLGLNVFRC